MISKRRMKNPPLEMVSQSDGAWYDGDVSLEGSQLRIHFNGFGSEDDEFWEGEHIQSLIKIREIVRLRSKQLQDSQCTRVVGGMIVCANFQTSDGVESKYYDARVLMVYPSKHSFHKNGKDELCNCRFKLLWEAGPNIHKEVYLGCVDISFIDNESIEKHSILQQFFRRAIDKSRQEDYNDDRDLYQSSLMEDNNICNVGTSQNEQPFSNESEGSVLVHNTMSPMSHDIVRKVRNYTTFYEFLGDEARKLQNALDTYNIKNQFH
ncbi:unnamed protein product [Calypogeia fissa]